MLRWRPTNTSSFTLACFALSHLLPARHRKSQLFGGKNTTDREQATSLPQGSWEISQRAVTRGRRACARIWGLQPKKGDRLPAPFNPCRKVILPAASTLQELDSPVFHPTPAKVGSKNP